MIGDNLFLRESGAVASQFHIPEAIEPYAAELVGAKRGMVLGKKSGLDSIRLKAEELGVDVPESSRASRPGKCKTESYREGRAAQRRRVSLDRRQHCHKTAT